MKKTKKPTMLFFILKFLKSDQIIVQLMFLERMDIAFYANVLN